MEFSIKLYKYCETPRDSVTEQMYVGHPTCTVQMNRDHVGQVDGPVHGMSHGWKVHGPNEMGYPRLVLPQLKTGFFRIWLLRHQINM
jgi:hypothetical protein